MARKRKMASTRWNQGAAFDAVNGGRFRAGAAAMRAEASRDDELFSAIVRLSG